MRYIPALALLLSGLATAASAEDEPRLFTAEDVFELEWADDPQVSPDGTQAVYVRRSNDIMADRTLSQVWLVNLDGSLHEPLLADGNSYRSPRWSPDGTRLAYMSSANGRTALNVHHMVMVVFCGQFINGMAVVKIVTLYNPCTFELCEYAINRG